MIAEAIDVGVGPESTTAAVAAVVNGDTRASLQPVAIFGGAFDPVTVAHVLAMERVAAEGFRVVVLPCADAHAFGKQMLPAVERVELLRLALGARFEISLLEIQAENSRTFDTWTEVRRRYADAHWVIGADHAATLERWHRGAQLRREVPFIVVERAGYPLAESGRWCLRAPHRFLTTTHHGSSTQARAAIRAARWDEAARLLAPAVLERIRDCGWYTDTTLETPVL